MRVLAIAALGLAAGLSMSPSASAQQLAQATTAARAGVAAAVRGDVKLAAVPGVREVGKDVTSGDPIFLGDQVTTGPAGRLQIMLLDETVFTIGPNAALVIDQFVYDPQTSAGKVTASVLKGTFRFVTGKVAKREPSDMEVKLPVGSIGVRGTSVAGETDGTRATVVLLGPGPDTNTNERVGRILVTGTGAGGAATTVEIVRPGFGTEIAGVNIPPSPPVRIEPARMAALTAPLAGTGPRPAPPPGAPAQGQGSTQGQAPSSEPRQGDEARRGEQGPRDRITTPQPPIPVLPKLASLEGAVPPPPPPPPPLQSVSDGFTTHEQLKLITAGSATFRAENVPLNGVNGTTTPGSFTYQATVNFGARTVSTSLTGSYALNGTNGTINFNESNKSYANNTGPISQNPMALNTTNATLAPGHVGTLVDAPRNVNGKIAAVLDIKVQIWTNGATCGTAGAHCVAGGRDNVPRGP